MPKRIEIDDEVLAKIESQCPKYLSPTGFINLLLDQGLTASATLVERRGDTPGRVDPLSEASSSKAVTSKTSNKSISMSLARHESEIREFWKVKKGSKGDTAWKLLMTELTKLQERYGDAVVKEQLQLAINGKWQGVRLSSYEQFKPKGNTPAQPEQNNHPASRVYTAKDFELPNPDNPLTEMF